MKHMIIAALCLLAAPVLAGGDEIVLKTGTLDDFDRSTEIIYDQTAILAQDQSLANREIGEIVLSASPDDEGDVLLVFHKDEGLRKLGAFPQSVGNPLFMVFIESVIRDMAGFTGGSPYYIRNRVKDALVNRPGLTEAPMDRNGEEIAVTRARMEPFAGDPNGAQMQGFETLTITAVMSDAVPGWYIMLEATARGDEGILYQRHVELQQ